MKSNRKYDHLEAAFHELREAVKDAVISYDKTGKTQL